jgi:hypothetical protein
MCMSGVTQYHPRPVRPDATRRHESTAESVADHDPNLFGPTPRPFEPGERAEPAADARPVGSAVASIIGANTQDAGGVIVELSDGTRLLICPV